jgi:hypothetical protein
MAMRYAALASPLATLPAVSGSPITQTLNATPGGSTSWDAPTAAPFVSLKNGVFQLVTTNTNVQGWRNVCSELGLLNGLHAVYCVEFYTYGGDAIALRLRDNNSSSGCRVWTWVDGVPQTSDFIKCGTTPGGGIFNWQLSGLGTTTLHRVRVYLHNCDFAGFNKPLNTLAWPVPTSELRIGGILDSWGDGAIGVRSGRTYMQTVAILLGAQYFVDAAGGSGYTVVGGGTIFGDNARLTRLAAAGLDVLVVAGSVNDDVNSSATPAQIQAAAAQLYSDWQVLQPHVPIIVIGAQSTGTGPTGDGNAARIANNNAVKAAALAAPNVLGFIDMIGEGWIVGTGYTRTVADGVTTSGSAAITSVDAEFSSTDVGLSITGTGIPGGTTILSVQSASAATLSANATASGSGVSFTITATGTNGPSLLLMGSLYHPNQIGHDTIASRAAAEIMNLLQTATLTG